MTRNWDTAKLETLLEEIQADVVEGIAREEDAGTPEENSTARVVGYWMCRLRECQDGPMPPKPELRRISGPLFAAAERI